MTDAVFGLWAEVVNLTRLKPKRRERYRASIFGSARTAPGHRVYRGVRRMWRGLVDWAAEQMLRPGFELASPEDMGIPTCVDTADEAIALIRDHQARWREARA